MSRNERRGLTIIDTLVGLAASVLLVVCAIAATAPGIDVAGHTKSQANLRRLTVAAANYAADWNDRQLTLVDDNLATYGKNLDAAVTGFARQHGGKGIQAILLGKYQGEQATIDVNEPGNRHWLLPISFDDAPIGWFRLPNAYQFSQYVSARFYDPVFYAPGDTAVMNAVAPLMKSPDEYQPAPDGAIYFSSYCWSPAALFDPAVMQRQDPDEPSSGFRDPWSIPAGFRAPPMSMCMYPSLKTHMLEHDWIRNRPAWLGTCDERVQDGTYGGCEPHYFNQYAFSEPNAAFFDGSVRPVLTNDVLDADARVREQNGTDVGLWYARPGGAGNGYYEDRALDPTRTSYHVFTVDGIRGRDLVQVEPR